MTPDDLKPILDLVQAHDLAELELEDGTFRLRVKRGGPHVVTHVIPAAPAASAGAPLAPPAPAPVAGPPEEGAELAIVKSPIVGTFYRAAEPGAPAFASVGDQVKKGQVLCIIEAMKLMNEIDSEYDGEIVSIYVENGQPVQYGERIFAIRLKP
jgi:acetyl-CoA carboxylase biotin carboxyl carrier protein